MSGTRTHTETYFHNGVAEVFLLSKKDVSSSSNKSPNGDVREKVMLLQSHVRQAQIALRITRVTLNVRQAPEQPLFQPLQRANHRKLPTFSHLRAILQATDLGLTTVMGPGTLRSRPHEHRSLTRSPRHQLCQGSPARRVSPGITLFSVRLKSLHGN